MTDFTILSRFRNKFMVDELINKLEKKGKTCYNFSLKPGDPEHPDAHPEDQMKVFESTGDFFNNMI